METVFGIVFGLAVLVFFLWLIGGRRVGDASPNQANKVGMLTGLMGGSVEEAAQAQFALKNLENKTGQPPTTQDLGTAVGMTLGANQSAEEQKNSFSFGEFLKILRRHAELVEVCRTGPNLGPASSKGSPVLALNLPKGCLFLGRRPNIQTPSLG